MLERANVKILRLMKDSIPQNEKRRIYIPARDLNYARKNLIYVASLKMKLRCFFRFIHERILLTHFMLLTEQLISVDFS